VILLGSELELIRAVVEEKLFRIYEFSPWLSKDDILKKHLKKVGGRFKKNIELLKDLVELTYQGKPVIEVAKELRVRGHRVSPEDVLEIYERYRRKGIARIKTIGGIEKAPKPEVFVKTALAPAEEVVKKLKEIPEKTEFQTLKMELEELLTKLEETAVPTPETEERVPPSATSVAVQKIAEDIIKLRMSGIIDNLFRIDTWIEVLMLATREGDPLVFFSRSPDMEVNQANLAAASAVILSVSKSGSESFEKGGIREILIISRGGFMMLKPITEDYIMIVLISRDARIGTVIRDISWVSKEIETILKGELQKALTV